MSVYTPTQVKAFEYIKNKILQEELVPGVLYSEKTIAEELGCSRTPVNAALARLSQDRYVDVIPSRGFQVHQIGSADVWSTYQFRTAIEGYCAYELAIMSASIKGQSYLKKMELAINEMQKAINEQKSHAEILDYDMLFHQYLVEFTGNEQFIDSFESYRHRLRTIALATFQESDRPRRAVEEHKAILEAIKYAGEKEPMNAYLAVKRHMEASRNIVLQMEKF